MSVTDAPEPPRPTAGVDWATDDHAGGRVVEQAVDVERSAAHSCPPFRPRRVDDLPARPLIALPR